MLQSFPVLPGPLISIYRVREGNRRVPMGAPKGEGCNSRRPLVAQKPPFTNFCPWSRRGAGQRHCGLDHRLRQVHGHEVLRGRGRPPGLGSLLQRRSVIVPPPRSRPPQLKKPASRGLERSTSTNEVGEYHLMKAPPSNESSASPAVAGSRLHYHPRDVVNPET